MNTDHDYKIGTQHDTCEDYAISGTVGNCAYAIVSDGCSSSDNTDFGARVLALSARETLRLARNSPLDYEKFGRLAIGRSDNVSILFNSLNSNFLDATLLVAWVENDVLTAYIYGDGVLLHRTAESVRAVHVEYKIMMDGSPKPAPAYLSYFLDPRRKQSYDDLPGTKVVTDCLIKPGADSDAGTTGTPTPYLPFDPVVITAPVSTGDVIVLCSDGIDTFRHADDKAIPWYNLVDDVTGFKNFEGVFVQRRMAALRHRCKKAMISHTDDVSVAAIVV